MIKDSVEVQVRYAETDQMGVVYHANYLVWCEIGRTSLMQKLGIPYMEMEEEGVLAPVTNVNMDYKYPARYGRKIKITTWVEEYTGVRVKYGYEITDDNGSLCLLGTSEHVLVNKKNFRPLSMKKHYPQWDRVYRENRSS